MIYNIPELGFENEFTDLDFLGKYVDSLVKKTGNMDYAVVHEWQDHSALNDPDDVPPPDAVLLRISNSWVRRLVVATRLPNGQYSMEFVEPKK
jgi:hypothetical protein